jgi:hypothetical protein
VLGWGDAFCHGGTIFRLYFDFHPRRLVRHVSPVGPLGDNTLRIVPADGLEQIDAGADDVVRVQ